MSWVDRGFQVERVVEDDYFFAGSNWDNQISKRFILKSIAVDRVIESSYYLHLKKDKKESVNVAFEPSTSFGCAVGCLFCASGSLFPITQLSSDDITNQVFELYDQFMRDFPNFSNIRKDVFYSGIGEPSLIMNRIIDTSQKIAAKLPELGFKLSTMGALPKSLIKLAKSGVEVRSLQIGIPHYDNKKIRYLYSKVPNYDLSEVLDSILSFKDLSPKSVIKINYIVIKGYNDDKDTLLKTVDKVTKIIGNDIDLKISCLNPTDFAKDNNLEAVGRERLEQLKMVANSLDIGRVYNFGPMNSEKLGCGQLAGNYQKGKKLAIA